MWRGSVASGERRGGFFRVEMTVVCMCESNLPPSAVRVGDVMATEAPGHLLFSRSLSAVPPSLRWQCHVVSPHMLVCSGGVRGGGGGGGDIGTWAAAVFFLSLSTLVFLLVRWLLTPSAPSARSPSCSSRSLGAGTQKQNHSSLNEAHRALTSTMILPPRLLDLLTSQKVDFFKKVRY